MKYKALLRVLHVLIYLKRFFWWTGTRIYFVLAKIIEFFGYPLIYLKYKAAYLFRKAGINKIKERLFKRSFLVTAVLLTLFVLALDQTVLLNRKNTASFGQKTIIYRFLGTDEEFDVEEVVGDKISKQEITPWRVGAVDTQLITGGKLTAPLTGDMAGIVAGGTAINKPWLIPGATIGTINNQVVEYAVNPGDTLGSIAEDFGVSIATILWENNLNERSIIRLGQILKIPPTTGIVHTVKKGDTVKKIATLYGAKPEDVIRFNHLKENGSDLVVGEKIMVPGGVRPRTVVTKSAVSRRAGSLITPPSAKYSPSASGFIWPSGARIITQYYGLRHHALDIAGPWQTANYAAKAGVVQTSQCGWNSGYGCYVIIDHGGGVKTLYGHNSKLLVSPGDYVEAGQTIALMGNTGHVRGVTGIHLHFEIIINGGRVNPLGYVR